ncbi:hypothetical protein LX32DRAFT_663378 [Colletotrichum zoysiae]|uniref:Uncharacterized protein n=1 Tax=Colletotrichum zoysiae TaxID=1216348 RepID=A0AAD9HI17_9PEZI|nr:hypothetical protein LX32DRAFT_663378 [Colletotrichum zoysiae]
MGKNKQQKKKPQLEEAKHIYVPFDVALDVRQLSVDMCARWERYGAGFESQWCSFSREDRADILGSAMPEAEKKKRGEFASDWDLEKMAEDPSIVVDLLRERATRKLPEQALEGFGGRPSDLDAAKAKFPELSAEAPQVANVFMALCDGDRYGVPYKAADQKAAAAALLPPGQDDRCLHAGVGDLILVRQSYVHEKLGIIFMQVWELEPEEQPGAKVPADVEHITGRFMEAVRPKEPAATADLEHALGEARKYKALVGGYWASLGVATGVLRGRFMSYIGSQPEQVLNATGEKNPLVVDKDFYICLFDAVNDVARHRAFWTYLAAVLVDVQRAEGEGEEDGAGRGLVLQEVAHVCHMGFQMAQSALRRYVQYNLRVVKEGEVATILFLKHPGECDGDGHPMVTLAVGLDDLGEVKPAIDAWTRAIVRVCHPETTAEAAFEQLEELKSLSAIGLEKIAEEEARPGEADALVDFIETTRFIGDLAEAVPLLPPVNGKKRSKGLFVSKCQRAHKDAFALRGKVDLGQFVVPSVRLGKPEVAAGALRTIDDFCRDKTGSGVAGSYDKAVSESLAELRRRCAEARAKQQKGKAPAPAAPSVFIDTAAARKEEKDGDGKQQQQGKKEKVKTRPAEAAEADAEAEEAPAADPAPAPEPPRIRVTATTAAVFESLFDRTQHRRPIAFAALEAAMAELGFAVDAQGGVGSATKFTPPAGSGWRPVTLHRPHGNANKIEGYRLLETAARFRDIFGWAAETFEVA